MKNLLITSSAIAMAATAYNVKAADGDGYSRPTSLSPVIDGVSNNFRNNNKGVIMPFSSGNNIINSVESKLITIGANITVNKKDVVISSIDLYGSTADITVNSNFSLGAVYNSVALGKVTAAKKELDGISTSKNNPGLATKGGLVVDFNGDYTLTLTGAADSVNGGISPTNLGATPNNYKPLGFINFASKNNPGEGKDGTLLINSLNGSLTTLGGSIFDNVEYGYIYAKTDLETNDASFVKVGKKGVDHGKTITLNMNNNSIDTNNSDTYVFGDNSNNGNPIAGQGRIVFNAALPGNMTLRINNNIVDKTVIGGKGLGANHVDERGVIEFVNAGLNNTLDINSTKNVTIGEDETHRMHSVKFDNIGKIVVSDKIKIFAKNLEKRGAGKTSILQDVNMGTGSTINIFGGELELKSLKTEDVNLDNSTVLYVVENGNISGNIKNIAMDGKGDVIDENGILSFTGNNIISGTIGENEKSLKRVEQSDGQLDLIGNNHYASSFNLSHANSVINVASGGVLHGNVTTDNPDKGELFFEGHGEVTGDIGKDEAFLDLVKLPNFPATLTLSGKEKSYYTNFQFGDDIESIIKITDGGTIYGNVAGENNEVGVLIFEKTGKVDGIIGVKADGSSQDIYYVQAGNGRLELSGKEHNACEFRLASDNSSEIYVMEKGKLNGDVITNGNERGNLIFAGNGRVVGDIGKSDKSLNSVVAGDGQLDLIGNNHYASSFNLSHANSVINVASGGVLHGNVTTDNPDKGELFFEGHGEVTGDIGKDEAFLDLVKLPNFPATLTLSGKEKSYYTNFQFGDDIESIIKITDGGTIYGNVAGENNEVGVLIFEKTGKVDGIIGVKADGSSQDIYYVQAGNGRLELSGKEHNACEFRLASDNSSEIYVMEKGKLNGDVITNGNERGNLIFAGNGRVVGDIGKSDKSLNSVVAGDGQLDLIGNNHYASSFTLSHANSVINVIDEATLIGNIISNFYGQGDLIFTDTGKVEGNIGSNSKLLSLVQFGKNGIITGDVYSESIKIAADRKIDFGGDVTSNSGIFFGNSKSAAYFNNSKIFDTKISKNGAAGILNFSRDITVISPIHNVSAVNFGTESPDIKVINNHTINDLDVITLQENVVSPIVTSGHSILFAKDNVEVGNPLTQSKSTVQYFGADVGKTLSFVNNGGGDSGLSIEGDGAIILKKIVDDNGKLSPGKVELSNGNLDVSNAKSLVVLLDDTGTTMPKSSNSYTVLQFPDNENLSKIDIIVENANSGSLCKWTASVDETTLKIVSDNAVNEKVEEIAAMASNEDATDIINVKTIITNNEPIAKEFMSITDDDDKIEMVKRLGVNDTSKDVVGDVVQVVETQIRNRLFSLNFADSRNKIASVENIGVAAGDEGSINESKYGIWLTPSYNESKQKSRLGLAGYKSKTFGASIGFDAKPNDSMIVGFVVSKLDSNIKHTDFKGGDKTDIDSLMFSMYGRGQLTTNWFVAASATIGSSRTKTEEKRKISNTEYQLACGKYHSLSFSSEILFNYNYLVGQGAIIPVGGMKFSRINDTGYRETGTSNQNLSIARKSLDTTEFVFGTKASYQIFDAENMFIIPEVYTFLNQELLRKKRKLDIRLESGEKIESRSTRASRSTVNIGGNLNMIYKFTEFSIGYDTYISNKFLGHQGTFKVRVNF